MQTCSKKYSSSLVTFSRDLTNFSRFHYFPALTLELELDQFVYYEFSHFMIDLLTNPRVLIDSAMRDSLAVIQLANFIVYFMFTLTFCIMRPLSTIRFLRKDGEYYKWTWVNSRMSY